MKKYLNQFRGGFTIIELIVVIAIIAVLAAIVMVNVTRYINDSKIATIKADMSTLKTAAAVYFAEHGGFNEMCASDKTFQSVKTAINKINKDEDFFCLDPSPVPYWDCESFEWSAVTSLPDSTHWCVDYSGFSGIINDPTPTLPPPCGCSNWID